MAQEQTVAATETYEVRLGGAADRERFLALYEDVWDRSRSELWSDWRFEATPYSSDVEMVVAERDVFDGQSWQLLLGDSDVE